jgi:FKBP-type peptidyl-prolyl cis-trans isomerase
MNNRCLYALGAAAVFVAVVCSAAEEGGLTGAVTSDSGDSGLSFTDRVSYCLGLDTGTSMKQNVPFLNNKLVQQGLRDGLQGNEPLLSFDEQRKTMLEFRAAMMEQQKKLASEREKKQADWDRHADQKGAENKKKGAAFLQENKAKPTVKTTRSGLQYEVIKSGTGARPAETDVVKVLYKGTLIDGTEFDSSERHGGQPAVFPLNRVIKGWTEGLQLMPVGSTYRFFIPPDLAYGEKGQPGSDIYPNAVLVFEVQLLGIEAFDPETE